MTPTAKEQKIAEIVRAQKQTHVGDAPILFSPDQMHAACNAVWEAALEHAAQVVGGEPEPSLFYTCNNDHAAYREAMHIWRREQELAAALRRESHPQQEKG